MSEMYETVIGLEVHVELATKTKIFCGCKTSFGQAPNTNICPVCTGMPGSLPVLNKQVLKYAIGVGMATNCKINRYCQFDRKNYFYPDNPQDYQISQLYLPICKEGFVAINSNENTQKIGITQIHMEEDAGKLIHENGSEYTLVDYNRSGVPLIEIVTEPDMRSSKEVIEFLNELRTTILYLGASDCRLNEGSMRVDVNISVKKKTDINLGTRTEMKNLNSFKAISHAIENESQRQIKLLESGEDIIMETRRWDDILGQSFAMRSKEDTRDYRYFPDPDLPPIQVSDEFLDEIKQKQPEFKEKKAARYRLKYGLPELDINVLTSHKHFADMFEETVEICKKPKKVSNWLMGETMRLVGKNKMDPEDISFSPKHLASIIEMVEQNMVSMAVAKEIFEAVFEKDVDPKTYAMEKKLANLTDEGILRETALRVIENNSKSVQDYQNGKDRALGFLVGQTMKSLGGKADPVRINEILKELLTKEQA